MAPYFTAHKMLLFIVNIKIICKNADSQKENIVHNNYFELQKTDAGFKVSKKWRKICAWLTLPCPRNHDMFICDP